MRRLLQLWPMVIPLFLLYSEPVRGQSSLSINPTISGSGALAIEWPVEPGWVYFLRQNDSLTDGNWKVVPSGIYQGRGGQHKHWVAPVGRRSFFDVMAMSDPNGDLLAGDPDGDGLTTAWEVKVLQSDPFVHSDVDGDGADDAWEIEFFGATWLSATADHDGDGISHVQENMLQFSNPAQSQAGGDTLKSLYEYDAAGRLVKQQLSSGRILRYTYDAVGNITSVTEEN